MTTDQHPLTGAYALHALSEEERDLFRRHLEECPACREEVDELEEVAARLGASETIAPPRALRARVLAAADRQPQLPPRVGPLHRARTRRLRTRLTVAAAAVVLVAGAIFGISQVQRGSEPPIGSPAVTQVFRAPDATSITVRTADGDRLRIALSEQKGRMALATRTLPRLPDREVYQLWTLRDGRATSAGVVKDLADGKVISIPRAGTKVAMTVEPAGGSRQPTSTPIVQVDPAAV